jgi:hypothetical protein
VLPFNVWAVNQVLHNFKQHVSNASKSSGAERAAEDSPDAPPAKRGRATEQEEDAFADSVLQQALDAAAESPVTDPEMAESPELPPGLPADGTAGIVQ